MKKMATTEESQRVESSSSLEQDDNDYSGSSSSSSSSSEDEDEVPVDVFGKDFFKTLSSLKSKDPAIYDTKVRFFKNTPDAGEEKPPKNKREKSDKPLTLRDYERDLIVSEKVVDEEDETADESHQPVTIAEGEKRLKDEFKNLLHDDEDDSEEELGGLLKKKVKTKKEREKEEADYLLWLKGQKQVIEDKSVESELKPLHDYWNNKDLDQNEEFLKDFILNKRFLEGNDGDVSDEDNILSEDEKVLIAQEEFEEKYNFRFENQEVNDVKRYPRQVDGSLRKKDDRRKRKRDEIRERKRAEKEKKQEIIKKQQKEKLREIESKLEELKKLTGNEQLAFDCEDILEDFDPEKHDKKMEQLYNDKFYTGVDEEKPQFDDEDYGDEAWQGEEDWKPFQEDVTCEDPDFNMDCEVAEQGDEATCSKKLSRKMRKKMVKKKGRGFTEVSQLERPLYDPQVHQSFQKYVDEYYGLDCEDFIYDLPCKYKYKSVLANDYGLSIEEILTADDKELNKWCPLIKLYKSRSQHVEANEVNIYRKKANDVDLKRQILPSLFKSEQPEGVEADENLEDTPVEQQNTSKGTPGDNPTSSKKRKKSDLAGWNKEHSEMNRGDCGEWKKNKRKSQWSGGGGGWGQRGGRGFKSGKWTKPEFSDIRLNAYGIKPKRFQKSKFKNQSAQD